MLQVNDVTKHFKSSGGTVAAVDGVSFDIPNGRFASIVGSSGSGKSTLLSLLGALDAPSDGSIRVGDVEITKLSARKQVAYRRSRIGFVFQQYYLVPNLTALENVMLPLEFAGLRAKARRHRAAELLKQVGITGSKPGRRPGKLSGGEQQRVSIARALANSPELILADEPTGNLDSRNGRRIVRLLKELSRSEGTTVVVVTHDRSVAADTDMTLSMQDGRIVDGDPDPDEED
ncbi:ABC transporter ATP-binding protein [Stackebrandtia nassauensis]|uniref:ABC transporter related protein n=1 Tax=Stackebrandtia nassauensis (strain DSM 44728 / CIP 108903 / NRRL B-16338 / NBRC 102104 / LLR-40K-21) TaxID=446470 RepID=D3Q0Q5_STANL|nr:ABC transporter ATP-binding protein [Stackebrandtia nassauensis]ADD41791.1 ABC transporter related protein [Stackebrandtia nassauensis DSM 44728]